MDTFMEKYNAVRDQKTPVYLGFVKNNPKSYISMVQLASLASNDKVVGEVEKLYATLSPELKALKPLFQRQRKESIVPKADEFLIETFKTREGYHAIFSESSNTIQLTFSQSFLNLTLD